MRLIVNYNMMDSDNLIDSITESVNQINNLSTLVQLQQLVADRIEVVTNSANSKLEVDEIDSDTGNTDTEVNNNVVSSFTNLPGTNNMVKTVSMNFSDNLNKSLLDELNSLFSNKPKKYQWLNSTNQPYAFGGRSYLAKSITAIAPINELMNVLNKQLDCSLDCCLISCYKDSKSALSRHSDDEPTIDQSHTICNLSLGADRVIEFYNKADGGQCTDSFADSCKLVNGSLLLMLPGCQQNMNIRFYQVRKQTVFNSDTLCLSANINPNQLLLLI